MDDAPTTSLVGQDDDAAVRLWLHGRPLATRRAYQREIGKLRRSIAPRRLHQAGIEDLQRHVDTLAGLAPRSRGLAVAAIRSFFDWHQRMGTSERNPAAALRMPKIPSDLAERILEPGEVRRLIAGGRSATERLVLALLYVAGLRAAELCGLTWGKLAWLKAEDGAISGAVLTITGKGGKTRPVTVPAETAADLAALRGAAALVGRAERLACVFPSPSDQARPLGPRQLGRLVKRAAKAAGLSDRVSPHWLRHGHASHALAAGADLALVRDTLGHASIQTTNAYLHARPGKSSASYLVTPRPDQAPENNQAKPAAV